jgi:hypothetical protein
MPVLAKWAFRRDLESIRMWEASPEKARGKAAERESGSPPGAAAVGRGLPASGLRLLSHLQTIGVLDCRCWRLPNFHTHVPAQAAVSGRFYTGSAYSG